MGIVIQDCLGNADELAGHFLPLIVPSLAPGREGKNADKMQTEE